MLDMYAYWWGGEKIVLFAFCNVVGGEKFFSRRRRWSNVKTWTSAKFLRPSQLINNDWSLTGKSVDSHVICTMCILSAHYDLHTHVE